MSSRLQLDVGKLSLRKRHLVNAYEVKAGIGVIAGITLTMCDSCLSALSVLQKRALYKYIYLFIARQCNSVRPSVCHVPVLDENGLTCCQFLPYGSAIILVLSNIFTKFRRGHPLRGR